MDRCILEHEPIAETKWSPLKLVNNINFPLTFKRYTNIHYQCLSSSKSIKLPYYPPQKISKYHKTSLFLFNFSFPILFYISLSLVPCGTVMGKRLLVVVMEFRGKMRWHYVGGGDGDGRDKWCGSGSIRLWRCW